MRYFNFYLSDISFWNGYAGKIEVIPMGQNVKNITLKRKYARICITIFSAGVVCIWFPLLFPVSPTIDKKIVIVGIIAILCSLIVKYTKLRCSFCGFGGLMPQWSKNDTYHCPKCGNIIHWE